MVFSLEERSRRKEYKELKRLINNCFKMLHNPCIVKIDWEKYKTFRSRIDELNSLYGSDHKGRITKLIENLDDYNRTLTRSNSY
jgi:hypothetical protein